MQDKATLRSDLSSMRDLAGAMPAASLFSRRSEHRSRKTNAINLGVRGSAPVRPQASWLSFFDNTLSFSHGICAANNDGVRVMDDAIADGVGKDGIVEFGMPATDVELGAKDG